jgi:uncharacterized peroxidase-related enzyme
VLAAAVAADWRAAPLEPDERVMLAFAEKLAVAPHTMARADVAGLRAAGFADVDVLDIVLLVCYRSFINRLADALGVELDAPFAQDGRLMAAIEAAMGRSHPETPPGRDSP